MMQLRSQFPNAGLIWRQAASALGSQAPFRTFATLDTSSADTHDDFKPQVKAAPAGGDVQAQIQADVSANDVVLFMKGVPEAPMCGFSRLAVRILDAYGVPYAARNVLADEQLREGVKKFSSWPTIPQVFIKGEFVGGSDVLMGMHENGELEKALEPIYQAMKQKQESEAK